MKYVLILLLVAGSAFASGEMEQTAEPETVELTAVGHRVHQDAADGLLDELVANTGIEGVTFQTYGVEEIHSTIMRQTSLPTAPFDVGYAFINYADPRFLDRLEPLNGWLAERPIEGFEEDFSSGLLEAITLDGELRGIPMRGVVDAVHVNTARFDERGVAIPQTIEEFFEAAEALTYVQDDGTQVYGFSFHGNPAAITAQVINFARAMYPERDDAGILTTEYEVVIDREPAIEAISKLQEMYAAGVIHPDAGTHTVNDVTRLYETGRLAMWIGNITNYDNFNDPERAVDAGASDVIAIPLTESYDGDAPGYTSALFWSFVIPKNSPNKAEAWEMVRHLSSYESQLHAGINSGNQPTRASVFESEEYTSSVPYAELAAALTGVAEVAWPPHPDSAQMHEIAGQQIVRAMYGDISPEEAARTAAEQLRALIND